jgi:hypothetical protein
MAIHRIARVCNVSTLRRKCLDPRRQANIGATVIALAMVDVPLSFVPASRPWLRSMRDRIAAFALFRMIR